MSKINDGLQAILDAIENMIEPKLDKLKFDKTYRAKVISSQGEGVYIISINNNNYSLTTTSTLNIGQIIKVKAPLNNFSDIYIEQMGGSATGTNDYNDLVNKPKINTSNTSSLPINPSETIVDVINLHKVSKTGSYNDLLNTPTKTSDFQNDGENGSSPYTTQLYVSNYVGENSTLLTIKKYTYVGG